MITCAIDCQSRRSAALSGSHRDMNYSVHDIQVREIYLRFHPQAVVLLTVDRKSARNQALISRIFFADFRRSA
jgi:hypothetical protein